MEKKDYQELSEEVFDLINKARQDPKCLLDDLKKMKEYFKGKEYRDPKLNYYLMTEEGVEAVEDAIYFINHDCKVVDKLERSEELNQSAKELVEHIGPDGHTSAQIDKMAID